MNVPNRILVDKEKVEYNGRKAYRLFFYDVMDGNVIPVISYIEPDDVVIERFQEEQPEEQELSQVEVFESVSRFN